MSKNLTVMIVGDGGVGKTNLIEKLFNKPFERRYIDTENITTYKKGGLTIYDWPGQIKYNIRFDKKIDLYIIMYDVTNTPSYKNIGFWKRKKNEFYNSDIPMIIVGNKIDQVNYRKIYDNETINISVKTNTNIQAILDKFNC